jgi:putative FmdB family regulatory protein
MPLYEYECRECRTFFEQYVRSFAETVACPRCSSASVEKQLSSFAFAGSSAAVPGAGGGCGCGRGGCGCRH